MKRYIKSFTDCGSSSALDGEYTYDGDMHWEAIAELDDGKEIRFTKPYTANSYWEEQEQQYSIEVELLDKATATGKEVTFYTVNIVYD